MIRLMLVASAAVVMALPASAQQNWEISGEWTGAYVCNQGGTALHLSIRNGTSADQVTAVFSFGPLKGNPGVPNGSYRMSGAFDPVNKHLTLRGEAWIDQPSGYVMVDLDGLMRGSGLYISGDVLGPGCSKFDVVRDEDDLVG